MAPSDETRDSQVRLREILAGARRKNRGLFREICFCAIRRCMAISHVKARDAGQKSAEVIVPEFLLGLSLPRNQGRDRTQRTGVSRSFEYDMRLPTRQLASIRGATRVKPKWSRRGSNRSDSNGPDRLVVWRRLATLCHLWEPPDADPHVRSCERRGR